MGRERQKRKRRAGGQPVQRACMSSRKVLSNSIIRANWNMKETLAQNYRRIGLVSKLNKRAGGVQQRVQDVEGYGGTSAAAAAQQPFAIAPTAAQKRSEELEEIPLHKDGQTGQLVLAVEEDTKVVGLVDDILNELEECTDVDEDEKEESGTRRNRNWITPMGHIGGLREGVASTPVTTRLEEIARTGKAKTKRHQSGREQDWIQKLVLKHGDDYDAMFRDRQLNVMQQSRGDIKARVRKWLAKQG